MVEKTILLFEFVSISFFKNLHKPFGSSMMVFMISASFWFAGYGSSMPNTYPWVRQIVKGLQRTFSSVQRKNLFYTHYLYFSDDAHMHHHKSEANYPEHQTIFFAIPVVWFRIRLSVLAEFKPKRSDKTSISKDWIILLEYSEFDCSLSMFNIEANSLLELPIRSLKRNTIRAWITERYWLLRNEVIKSFITRRFSQDNPVKFLICFTERLYSLILSSNVEFLVPHTGVCNTKNKKFFKLWILG